MRSIKKYLYRLLMLSTALFIILVFLLAQMTPVSGDDDISHDDDDMYLSSYFSGTDDNDMYTKGIILNYIIQALDGNGRKRPAPTPRPTEVPGPSPPPNSNGSPTVTPTSTPWPTLEPNGTPIPSKVPNQYNPVKKPVIVQKPPIIKLNGTIALSKISVFKNEPVTLDASASYDPDGRIVKYYWDFGDEYNGDGSIVTHKYSKAGEYNIKLTIIDNKNLRDSYTKKILVLNKPPVSIPMGDVIAVKGTEAKFNGSSSYDIDGHIVKYKWYFEDDGYAEGLQVSHIFEAPGKYNVTLNVTDDDGVDGISTMAIDIYETLPSDKNKNGNAGALNSIVKNAGASIIMVAAFLFIFRKRQA
jgi:PKD repeat protein